MTEIETLAGQVVTKATKGAIVKLLQKVLDHQNETQILLRDMKVDVEPMLHGPYQTSLMHVAEAVKGSTSPAERKANLTRARQEMMRALGQVHDPLLRSEVALCLSSMCLASGDQVAAGRYAGEAATEMIKGIEAIVVQTNKSIKRHRFAGSMTGAMGNGFRKRLESIDADCQRLCARQRELVGMAGKLGVSVPVASTAYIPEFVFYGGPYGPMSGSAAHFALTTKDGGGAP